MPKILVTGGAGYIGSHTTLALCNAGYDVVVYDNLSYGRKEAVLPPARLVTGDLLDKDRLFGLVEKERFDGIIHFAGGIVVPESVEKPIQYYANNTAASLWLVEGAVKYNVPNFIFSSTAAVYGDTTVAPLTEEAPLAPTNPYGRSKMMIEWIIRDTAVAHPELNWTILRYFNVAGADPEGRLGQCTPVATHLIKVAAQAVLGKRDGLTIFGDNYPTPDGTCIRDYVHVTDLANIHVLALQRLEQGGDSDVFNCGYGTGYSVREVVDAVKKVAGDFPVSSGPRRPGDVPELVADSTKLQKAINWTPEYADLETIARSAVEWERKLQGENG